MIKEFKSFVCELLLEIYGKEKCDTDPQEIKFKNQRGVRE